jgi:hypothetical protein
MCIDGADRLHDGDIVELSSNDQIVNARATGLVRR